MTAGARLNQPTSFTSESQRRMNSSIVSPHVLDRLARQAEMPCWS